MDIKRKLRKEDGEEEQSNDLMTIFIAAFSKTFIVGRTEGESGGRKSYLVKGGGEYTINTTLKYSK